MNILHFELIRKLGAGGMGEVHLARDTKLDRQVALKFLPDHLASDPEPLRRFESEARALASLNHPNIVAIYSVEQDGDRVFLVMELVTGITLAERLKGRPLERAEFFDISIALADALAAAHERGIVHRDLKPSNVMIAQDGTPKILDFGLAKLMPEPTESGSSNATTQLLSGSGRVAGTPSFMSPEQLQGRPIDQRSDLFSLGTILYLMATGRPPFRGRSEAEVISAILRDTPDAADKVEPALPHHIGRLLRLCLEKNAEQRLQSARDLRNELLELRRELTTGEVPTQAIVHPIGGRGRAARRMALIAAVAVLLIAGFFALQKLSMTKEVVPDEPGFRPEVRELLDQGHLMEMRGDTIEDLHAAEDRYRRALELDPNQPLLRATLALLLTRTQTQYPEEDREAEIRDLTAQALATGGDLALAHVADGAFRYLVEEFDGAAEAAQRAIGLDASEYRGHTLLGKALIRTGSSEAGLAELRQGVQLAGADVRARLALAKALQDSGQRNEAAVEYEKILSYDPDHANALNNLALIYARSGRELEAIPLLKRLLRVRRYEGAANNLGQIYLRQGRFDEAIEAFEQAYEIDPTKPVIPHSLGEAYEKLGDPETARRWFLVAHDSYSRDLAAGGDRAKDLGLRAVCAAKLGRFDAARADIAEALALAPNHLYRLANAAQVHALAGDRDEAFRYVRLAVAGGYPPSDLLVDPTFAAWQDDPEFLALLELEAP